MSFLNPKTNVERIIPIVIVDVRRPVELQSSVLQQQSSALPTMGTLCFVQPDFVHLPSVLGVRFIVLIPRASPFTFLTI